MKLYKNGMVKELNAEKAIKRWIKFGWKEVNQEPVSEEQPKRRGRPAKVTNGND